MSDITTEYGSEFSVAGYALWQLEALAGNTPFYVYERKKILERVKSVSGLMPERFNLSYSMKANPWTPIVCLLSSVVDHVDVASAGELILAVNAGFNPDKIMFAGPGKGDSELRTAIAVGAIISIESENELKRAFKAAEFLGCKARIMVRINPEFAIKQTGMQMGGKATQFGVDATQLPRLLSEFDRAHMDFVGFHIFWGSQCLNEATIVHAQTSTFELLEEIIPLAPGVPEYVNIGGGIGIPYFENECSVEIEGIFEAADSRSQSLRARYPQMKFVVEFGRYLVGESGLYVCKVIDRKESFGKTFVVTDGGMHHQLAASGNLGQVIRRNYPISVVAPACVQALETVTIVGRLCTPIDVLAKDIQLPKVQSGSFILIHQSGAYGLTASPTEFLGHPRPSELLL